MHAHVFSEILDGITGMWLREALFEYRPEGN